MSWVVALIVICAGIYVALSTSWIVQHGATALPVADQWDEIAVGRETTLKWLLSQRNEHRQAIPRLLFVADASLADASNKLLYGAMLLMLAMTAGLAAALAAAERSGAPIRLMAVGIALAIGFWDVQAASLLWGAATLYYCVLLAACAAFSLLAFKQPSWPVVCIAVLLTAIAIYSSAAGLMVAPLLLLMAWRLHWPRHLLIALGLCAGILEASYFIGYTPPTGSIAMTEQLHAAPAIIAGFLIELGAVFSGGFALSFVLGLLGLVTLAVIAWRGRDDRFTLALVALAVFTCAVSMLIALGRGRAFEGLQYALTPRYMTFTIWFWAALALALLRLWPPRIVSVLLIPVIGCVLVIQVTHPAMRDPLSVWAPVRLGIPALLTDVKDAEMLGYASFGNPDMPLAHRAIFRAEHKSVFAAPWSRWLGTRWSDLSLALVANQCRGAIIETVRLDDPQRPGWRIIGAAWDLKRNAPIERLVLVSAAGVIVGYGLGGLKNLGPPDRTGFIGAARNADGLVAYGLLGEHEACRLE